MAKSGFSGCARRTSGWCAMTGAAAPTPAPWRRRRKVRVAPRRAAFRIARLALLASLFGAAFASLAVDLGKGTVRSRIGQPLNAEIEVLSLRPGEDKTLAARLASREAYQQAGLDFNR